MAEEKQDVERTIAQTNNPDPTKEEPIKNDSYIPQSDEEYVVTMKTWCVVLVGDLLVGIFLGRGDL